jgi:hypothetical protein
VALGLKKTIVARRLRRAMRRHLERMDFFLSAVHNPQAWSAVSL